MPNPWEYEYDEGDQKAPEGPWDFRWEESQPTKSEAESLTFADQLGMGMADPIHGGAQLLYQMAPESVRNSINKANNLLAQYGFTEPVGEGGIAQLVADREQEYKDRRGADGVDWMRLSGNVLSPANLALGYLAGPSLTGQLTAGAVSGALNPEESLENFTKDNVVDASVALGATGLLHGVTRGASSILSPYASRNPDIQALVKEGVKPTFGQLMGPKWSKGEEGLASAPILGSSIKESRLRAMEDFNRAVANRTLRHVNQSLPEKSPAGYSMIDEVERMVGMEYDNLLPRLSVKNDPDLTNDLKAVQSEWAKTLPPAHSSRLKQLSNQLIRDELRRNRGTLTGENLKAVETRLGEIYRGMRTSQNFDDRQLAMGVKDLQQTMRDAIIRQNPSEGEKLQQVNKAWHDLIRMEDAATRSVVNEGVFTPGQYMASLKKMDSTRGKRSFAKGAVPNQDFGVSAQRVLGSTIPDSGTPFRTALGLGVLGGGYMAHPGVALAELALSLAPYSNTGQSAANLLLARRPEWAHSLAGGLNQVAPYLIPGTTNLALEGLEE